MRAESCALSALNGRGGRRSLVGQGFFTGLGHAGRRNIGNNSVLTGCKANLAVAIDVGQARKLVELLGVDSARRNAKSHVDQSRLFLRTRTKMGRDLGPAHVSALERHLAAPARPKDAP